MRLRGVSAVALLAALCLLPAGIGLGMGQSRQARAALHAGLSNKASEQVQLFADYFERSRSIDLLTANNPAFARFYDLPGTLRQKLTAGGPVLDEINQALGYLEELFPGSIGETCFIDRSGAEVARMVRGERAPLADLSPDEADNPFFAPTFALDIGSVHQAHPYISPDTNEWVISNSTPLRTSDGSKPAMVHFEVTIESFRAAAARTGQFNVAVVDAATGAVVIDSRYPQQPGALLGRPKDTRFKTLAGSGMQSGTMTLDGRAAAYQRLPRTAGNVNDWYVVAVAPAPVGLFYGIGGWSLVLVGIAVLLLVVAAAADRIARRELMADAATDPLTGLGNRRKLTRDLRRQLQAATDRRPLMLMMFDLNGFKAYNDAFGHSAGDELLSRLGRALDAAMASRGSAYRLGGDEFCILAPVRTDGIEPTIAAAQAALTEHGSGFTIDASYGTIQLPTETRDPAEALRLVDQRMYAQKRSGRRSADRQSKDVLLRALHEHNPNLGQHVEAVASLVGRVAGRMGLSVEETQQAIHAAELHDVGQVAIPDAILTKDEPLDDDEIAFLQSQPIIAERIISAAPALAQVARLVRSTGEHFNGTGYPDQLTADQIPLGARIVTACHRYVTLTTGHGTSHALPQTEALNQLLASAVLENQHSPELV